MPVWSAWAATLWCSTQRLISCFVLLSKTVMESPKLLGPTCIWIYHVRIEVIFLIKSYFTTSLIYVFNNVVKIYLQRL